MATLADKIEAQQVSLNGIERVTQEALIWLEEIREEEPTDKQLQRGKKLLANLMRHCRGAVQTVGDVLARKPQAVVHFPLRSETVSVFEATLKLLSALETESDLSALSTEREELRSALIEFLTAKSQLEI